MPLYSVLLDDDCLDVDMVISPMDFLRLEEERFIDGFMADCCVYGG